MHPCTVMVVEDDPILRCDAVTLFENAGYEVAEFETADQAAQFIRERPHDIGAVFTDVNTPGSLDGIELASMVNTRWPAITVLVTSARYGTKPDSLPPSVRYIPKPWLPLDLLVTLQRATDPV